MSCKEVVSISNKKYFHSELNFITEEIRKRQKIVRFGAPK